MVFFLPRMRRRKKIDSRNSIVVVDVKTTTRATSADHNMTRSVYVGIVCSEKLMITDDMRFKCCKIQALYINSTASQRQPPADCCLFLSGCWYIPGASEFQEFGIRNLHFLTVTLPCKRQFETNGFVVNTTTFS